MKLTALLLFLPLHPPRPLALPLAALLALQVGSGAQEGAWTAREAEHLLNRAAFGARPDEVAEAVALGREGTVERLLSGSPFFEDPYYARPLMRGAYRMEGMSEEERREAGMERRREDRRQLEDFLGWWVERMVDGKDPLRERMVLFWHEHLPSSYADVRDSYDMIQQNQLFRTVGLGSFVDVVHGIVRDPAMLDYLDNDSNEKESPNENLARELMELFVLGEGNYGEEDVREVARALTGWTVRGGRFRVVPSRHDDGEKTILGETGAFDGNDVVKILLRQEACARHLARGLIAWFEGVEPDAGRVEEYATLLRDGGYEIAPVLRALFQDERFYRDEVVGQRVAGPVDYLVGSARRLGVRPPARFLLLGASLLGQRLFFPPNVKGWEGGETWLTTSTVMQRSNLTGVLLGVVDLDDFLEDQLGEELGPAAESMGEDMAMAGTDSMDGNTMEAGDDGGRQERSEELRRLRRMGGVDVGGRLNLSARLDRAGIRDEEAIVAFLADDLLGVPVEEATLHELARYLADERRAAGLTRDELVRDPYLGEDVLRRLAHLVLSLPEAQFH